MQDPVRVAVTGAAGLYKNHHFANMKYFRCVSRYVHDDVTADKNVSKLHYYPWHNNA